MPADAAGLLSFMTQEVILDAAPHPARMTEQRVSKLLLG